MAKTIGELLSKCLDLYESGDMKSLSEFYTEDCKYLEPGMPMKTGRKASEDVHSAFKESGTLKITLKNIETVEFGDFAYQVNSYRMHDSESAVTSTGKMLLILKRISGTWFIHIDCFNADEKED